MRYFREGEPYRAWVLLNKQDGSLFKTFEEFCEYPQPWGLGVPYVEFKAYLGVKLGERAADLVVVPPSQQGERTDQATSPHGAEKLATSDKDTRLRAILRSPESIQALYRDGLINQTTAAKLGPDTTVKKGETDEQKGKRLERERKAIDAREAIGMIPRVV